LEQKTHTILIADDDPATLMLLRTMLSKTEYNVITVGGGAEVLEKVNEVTPDLFLLDIMMPGMDGLEVCRNLKQDVRLNQIPVVFITVKVNTDDLLHGFEAGAADYITKPVKKPELLARINTHIRLYHSILELERLNQLAFDANPSTGLPGNNSINEAITRAIEGGSALCVIYCDLDDFKAFNDKYGFVRGDRAINYTAAVIRQCMEAVCGPGCFIGHIGGDDFIIIVPSEMAKAVADEVILRFDKGIREFYDPEDVKAGCIVSHDRQGQEKKFPIMSISMGGVDLSPKTFNHYLEVADACAEIKKTAKAITGSSICFERRKKDRSK